MMQPHVFGVRHLSPGGAWHLLALLDRVRPKVVLIEAPADASNLLPDLTRAGTRPPIAILAYTDSVPVRTFVYPLAEYSPEYQAIRWAKQAKARVEFIDLPSDVFLGLQDVEWQRLRSGNVSTVEPVSEVEQSQDDNGSDWRADASPVMVPEPQRSIYERIAERSGEPDYDTFWERRFEHNLSDQAYQLAALTLGRELREEPDPLSWRAENLVREAYMRRRIQDVIACGVEPERIVVVVGAFHAPVLGLENPAITDEELRRLPRRGSKLTLMPYSYFRLSSQSGYGAGNRAPAYFQMAWEQLRVGRFQELPQRYLSELARLLRESGHHRSTAEVIEAVRLAETLSALHDGYAPTLADLHDAAVTLMAHGDRGIIAEALARVDVGTAIGELPEGVSRTSIQDDFERHINRLKLNKYKSAVAQELSLDLRENRYAKTAQAAFLDLERSSFFHRLRVLGVEFAIAVPSRQDQATWEELWRLQWRPECEIALVEAVLLGETIELATAYQFQQRLNEATAIDSTAAIIRDACLCQLPAAMDAARRRLQELAAESSDLKAIALAADELRQVIRYGDVRKFEVSPLLPLLEVLFVQGCLSLDAAATCDAKTAQELMPAIDQFHRISLEHAEHVEVELWHTELHRLANADDRNPLLSGYAAAILLERGLMATAELSQEISRRLSPGIPADLGAGWFEGLSQRNRPALLARQVLWEELARYVEALDAEQFLRAVVVLRRALGSFTPAQKRQICENLAEFWQVERESAQEALGGRLSEAELQQLAGLNDFNFDNL